MCLCALLLSELTCADQHRAAVLLLFLQLVDSWAISATALMYVVLARHWTAKDLAQHVRWPWLVGAAVGSKHQVHSHLSTHLVAQSINTVVLQWSVAGCIVAGGNCTVDEDCCGAYFCDGNNQCECM